MPGNPSRDTFDPAKAYDFVRFIGGSDRRLFDAELNEAQEIIAYRFAALAEGVAGRDTTSRTWGGGGAPPCATGVRLGASGLVSPSGNPHTVLIDGGVFIAGGFIFRWGGVGGLSPNHNEETIFTGGDPGTEVAQVYLQVHEAVVDSTVDPDLIDPGYGIETAQRVKLVVQLIVDKFGSAPGDWPTPAVGYFNVPLATITNGHATLLTGDIVEAPFTSESGWDTNQQLIALWVAVNALSPTSKVKYISWMTGVKGAQIIYPVQDWGDEWYGKIYGHTDATGVWAWQVPIDLPVGSVITEVKVFYYFPNDGTTGSFGATIFRFSGIGGGIGGTAEITESPAGAAAAGLQFLDFQHGVNDAYGGGGGFTALTFPVTVGSAGGAAERMHVNVGGQQTVIGSGSVGIGFMGIEVHYT